MCNCTSRHQDHTTSPSALAAFVSRTNSVHRIPRSTSVTIAIRPSCEAGRGIINAVSSNREVNYFWREGWTGFN
jgi:hypothetical protein